MWAASVAMPKRVVNVVRGSSANRSVGQASSRTPVAATSARAIRDRPQLRSPSSLTSIAACRATASRQPGVGVARQASASIPPSSIRGRRASDRTGEAAMAVRATASSRARASRSCRAVRRTSVRLRRADSRASSTGASTSGDRPRMPRARRTARPNAAEARPSVAPSQSPSSVIRACASPTRGSEAMTGGAATEGASGSDTAAPAFIGMTAARKACRVAVTTTAARRPGAGMGGSFW